METNSRNENGVAITMPTATWLVIFEFLSRSYEEWAKKEEWDKKKELTDTSFAFAQPEAGERVAMWKLEGAIERTLPEIFSPEYETILTVEKAALAKELYGPSSGQQS